MKRLLLPVALAVGLSAGCTRAGSAKPDLRQSVSVEQQCVREVTCPTGWRLTTDNKLFCKGAMKAEIVCRGAK